MPGLAALYSSALATGAGPGQKRSVACFRRCSFRRILLYRIEIKQEPQRSQPQDLWTASSWRRGCPTTLLELHAGRRIAARGWRRRAGGGCKCASASAADVGRPQKAQQLVDNFGAEWLSQRSLSNVSPDPQIYKTFDEDLRSAMRNETLLLFKDVASGELPVNQLLTSNYTYLNDRLAQHYGLPAPGSSTPVRPMVPPARGGLLTQASLLTVLSHANESAPVLRGKWILSQLLCQDIPPPPANVPAEPAAMTAQSRRDRLAAHRVNPTCAGCHGLMDPLGLALEQYDGIGAFRATDNGVAIDTSGTTPDGKPRFATPQSSKHCSLQIPASRPAWHSMLSSTPSAARYAMRGRRQARR